MGLRSPNVLAVPLALLLTSALCGCLAEAGTRVAPVYRQGLIDPDWDPLAAPPEEPRADRRPALLRCRALAGKTLGTSTTVAEQQLLIRCLGRQPGVNVEAMPERRPRPLDLAIFTEARPTASRPVARVLGVVLNVAGDRVEFLYARNTRAGVGVLNLRRPDRRRGPRGAVDNTYLRVIQPADPRGTRYLAGQLLSGFAVPSL